MKTYIRRRPVRVAPPPAAAPPPELSGAAELLAELAAFAAKAAASPNPGASAAVAADLADELLDSLRALADVAGAARPRAAVFDASDVAARTWTEPLAAAVSAASKALARPSARMQTFEVEDRRFNAQRRIGECRSAIRSAGRRLDGIASRDAARHRLAERGVTLIRYKCERR